MSELFNSANHENEEDEDEDEDEIIMDDQPLET